MLIGNIAILEQLFADFKGIATGETEPFLNHNLLQVSVMTYIVMAYVFMAYVAMTCIVMAY